MENIIKGSLFNTSDKKLNISDVMCSSSKKNNFVEKTIKKAKELGYKIIKQNCLNNMEEANKNTYKKLHISDISCSICGKEIKLTTGHSITWKGVYDIKRCGCGTNLFRKH